MKKVIYTILLVFFSLFTAFGIWVFLTMVSQADAFNAIVYGIWSLFGIFLFNYFRNKKKNLNSKTADNSTNSSEKPSPSKAENDFLPEKTYKTHNIHSENKTSPKEKKSNVTNRSLQNTSDIDITNIPEVTIDDIPESNQPTMEYYDFKVVGVTFKTGRKSRQTALRRIYFHDEPYETVDIELKEYEYEGEPAIGVFVNDFQVGNIARKDVHMVIDLLSDEYSISYTVYGGGDKYWGMAIKLSKES